MPLLKGKGKNVLAQNFHEFRHGETYARTAKKFGKEKANDQMIAAIMSNMNGKKKGKK